MKKKLTTVFVIAFLAINASSQTLFTYGKYSVDAPEFLRAYNKNNTQPVTLNKAKAISDYLELYINSRLKIREAYDRRYDTLAQIKVEVENLRTQIAESYMNDPQMITKFQKEAFDRSQKDIEIAHIFISLRNNLGQVDSAAAKLRRDNILQRLQKGEDFLQVAQQASEDPAAKTSKGYIGYITLFTLPYEFETPIYNTPVGKYTTVTSKAGYHIFKNISERKAVGKMRVQQILLAFPPGATDAEKKQVANRADSLYKRALAGDNFHRLAAAFSNDYVTGVNGGVMPDISVGQYDADFEKGVWSLTKDNQVGKPFLTHHGWHILKRLSAKPVVTDINNKSNLQELQGKIMGDSRWKSSKDFIYTRVIEKAGLKHHSYNDQAMHEMSDSVLDLRPMTALGRTIIATTPMFTIGDSTYDATAWVNYANTYRYKQDGSGAKPYEQVKDEFLKFSLYNYYRSHLENFNEEFKYQMNEFKDGNIFFEIMQQEIWNKAQVDTTALMALYEQNRKNYMWDKSADAVLFFCSDENTAKKVYEEVKKNPHSWRKIAENYSEKVVVDSSRYEWTQIPNLQQTVPKAGIITLPLLNTNDNTASFAYIVAVHSQPLQRTFNEARGLVINDYQLILEKQWTEKLRKKYPVVIDQKVLAEISK